MEVKNVYEFIDLQLTHEDNKFKEIQAYITKYFAWEEEIYFILILLRKCILLTSNGAFMNDKPKMLKDLHFFSSKEENKSCFHYFH